MLATRKAAQLGGLFSSSLHSYFSVSFAGVTPVTVPMNGLAYTCDHRLGDGPSLNKVGERHEQRN
jgi:hypothetical protein